MKGELERARGAEPAWDEVRERRVLTRVLSARERARSRRIALRRGLAVSALAVAVVAVAVIAVRQRGPEAPQAATSPATSPSRLALTEGSVIELSEGARVEIVRDDATLVRVAHEAGEARYVVSHRPSRTFTVACGEVDVVVRGTRFVVRREGSQVSVDVEEGRVEVRRGGESSMLVRGESLRVDTALHALAPPSLAPPSLAPPSLAPPSLAPPSLAPPSPATATAPIAPLADLAADPTPPAVAVEAPRSRRESPATRSTAVAQAEPASPASVDALLAEADAARREHRLSDAADALHAAIAALGSDPRAATAFFILGRVERSRGRPAAAATAFDTAYARDPDAVLAEDALAESVVSYADAGDAEHARANAARYAARFPSGHYAERVRGATE